MSTDPAQYPLGLGAGGQVRFASGLAQGSFCPPGCGVWSECGRLRSVLLHRPGPEIESVRDPEAALWIGLPDPAHARDQHDALAGLYRSLGVDVHYLPDTAGARPNQFYVRDTFAMTPRGAIIAKPATAARMGEERLAERAVAALGVRCFSPFEPSATFEGADLMIVDESLAFVAAGNRTNRSGAFAVREFLLRSGIGEVVIASLSRECLHLDCALSIVHRNVAVADPRTVPPECVATLRRRGFKILTLRDGGGVRAGMPINNVAVEPGVIILPSNKAVTLRMLGRAGITCIPVEISELMKGAGGVHCMTGVIGRCPI